MMLMLYWDLVVFFFLDLNLKNIKNNNIPLKHWGRRAPAQPTDVTQPEAVWIASRTFEDRDMPPNRGFMVFIYLGFRRSNHYLLTNCEMSEELLLPARAHIPLLQPYHWRAAAILGCDSHQSLTTGADNQEQHRCALPAHARLPPAAGTRISGTCVCPPLTFPGQLKAALCRALEPAGRCNEGYVQVTWLALPKVWGHPFFLCRSLDLWYAWFRTPSPLPPPSLLSFHK